MISLTEVQEAVKPIARLIDVETEVPVLYHYASSLEPGQVYLEIGTWMGCSATIVALSSHDDAIIWTVDCGKFHEEHWQKPPSEYRALLRSNFAKYGVEDKVNISLEGTMGIDWSGPIHLLFIDGHHGYKDVKADTVKWQEFIPVGGVILFHDYTRYDGVERAADELEKTGWELVPGGGSIRALRRSASCQDGSNL